MPKLTLDEQLAEIKAHDVRHNDSYFYVTFRFDQLYSPGMLNMITKGTRQAKHQQTFQQFLQRCVDIYREHTHDYRFIDAQVMADAKWAYEQRHGLGEINKNSLGAVTTLNQTNVTTALTRPNTHNQLTPNLYELFTLDLLHLGPDTPESLFLNIDAYQRLDRLVMRLQIGDGTQVHTVNQVAKQVGLPVETLRHLEQVCQSPAAYLKTYSALAQAQVPYNFLPKSPRR